MQQICVKKCTWLDTTWEEGDPLGIVWEISISP